MRETYTIGKRIMAMLLCVALLAVYLPGTALDAKAATNVYGGLGVKKSDPATVNNWKDYIGKLDTSLAGGVWTDKSVFETAQDYLDATDEAENFTLSLENPRNFMIALSAMASSKNIVGYSYQPIDVMLVLDVSGSMDSSSRDVRMVEAANKAIGDLLALNNYNRVGVVLYSDSATLLMPLDRYTTSSTTTLNNTQIPSYIYLSNNDDVSVSSGVRNSNNTRPNASREVIGGTYIQSGIYMGMKELTDPDLDTVITEGFQIGITRTPIMVLMSDGAPTYGVNTYTIVSDRNMGNGGQTNADMAFMTQLSAAYAKAKIAEKYGSAVEPLFYNLGLGVGSNPLALGVMDPMNQNADADVNTYWTEFNSAAEGDEITLDNTWYRTWEEDQFGTWQETIKNRTVTKLNDGTEDGNDTLPLSQNYVDQYFPASNTNDLSTAFQSIVDTIILQTMYYPTLVEDGDVHHSGYLEFYDYIEPNMEVKAVEGVQLGGTLYTGEHLAQMIATGMGTVENPTEAGNELVHSVVSRLGMTDIPNGKTAVEQARELLASAWTAGQLSYNEDYDGNVTWSNQICWYADADGKYLGFWDGDGVAAEMVGIAAYTVRSYGFLGEVGIGNRQTDMLYATFQVRSALDAQGNVIEDIVCCRIPASLIPVSIYNITLNSNDPTTATEITMTMAGATAPMRLVFEVGLRQEIDLLDMEGTTVEDMKQDADGNFIFYTNQWDATGIDEGKAPDKLHNTYVTFKPSEENERYYYHEDMPIYVKSGSNYVRYTGTAKPAANDGNTYYRAYVIYTATANGGRADYEVEYQVIPDSALAAESVADAPGGGWVVKRGTLYLQEARAAIQKTANETETLPYAEYPNVHIDATRGYHLDAILGNNGVLTIDAPEGLKLTKKADATIADNGQTYSFTVTRTSGSHDDATIYLITEIDGQCSAWTPITFADTYTVELGIGDSAWLVGLPEGNQYKITENIDGEYEVGGITVDSASVDVAQVTVQKNHIVDVEFTNTAVFTGDISISKQVVSSYNDHESEAFAFDFDVTITGANAGETYKTVLVKANGSQTAADDVTADASGEANYDISLGHGQSLLILNLPKGASVTAKETQKPGFTSNMSGDTATAQVVIGETTHISFINTYKAAPVSPHGIVDVYAEKILQGRSWAQGDSFSFVLEKHNSDGSHTEIETVCVDYDDTDKIADFQSNANELFTTAGTYSYRITETHGTLPGIAYDTAVCYFDIVVKDDGEGSLYIADVIGRQDVKVEQNAQDNTWDVIADFTNVYNASGAIQASLSVKKDVKDKANSGIGKDGFVFELYDADKDFNIGTMPRSTAVTNAQGVASFHDILFTSEGTHYFLLKEQKGSITKMTYSTEVYYCTVEVTSNPTTSGLVAKATVLDSNKNTVYSETVEYVPGSQGAATEIPVVAYTAPFTNVYEPASVKAELTGEKNLVGRDITNGEFTFELYNASYNGTQLVTGAYITDTTNAGKTFTFKDIEALTFTETGYYIFAIKEKKGNLGGMTYDENTIYAVAHVVSDLNAGALRINSLNYMDAETANVPALFTNTYTAAPVDIILEADKEMTGSRKLAAGMFQFSIYETDDTYTVSGDPLQTVTNDTQGNVEFPLHYTTPGEYYYVIRERIPTNVDADGRLHGVKYDTASYRVKVVVADKDLRGQLVAEETYLDGKASFVNDYTPAPTKATLRGVKTLSGHTQTAGTFSFALYQTNAQFIPLDNVADDTAGNFAVGDGTFAFEFEELTFTKAGGYRYIVVEQDTGNAQVDYDKTVFYVLIEVKDDGSGKLISQTSVGTAVDSNGIITMPVTSMEFFNVFNHAPAKLAIAGNKTLVGQTWDKDNANHIFTFEMYEANELFHIIEGMKPLTASNDPTATGGEGKFIFPELIFEQKGTYYYVAKEKLPEGISANDLRDDTTGISYDPTELKITVSVDVDPQDTTRLKATYTVANTENAVIFTNTYTAQGEVPFTLSGEKKLTGKDMVAGEFTFELYQGDKLLTSATNDEQGNFLLKNVTFTEKGEHLLTVVEKDMGVDGMEYDTREYNVKVVIADNGVGGLVLGSTEITLNGVPAELVFENTYIPEKVAVELGIEKKIRSEAEETIGPKGFKFLLKDESGKELGTVESDEQGNAKFSLEFNASDIGGVFRYTISEVDTGRAFVTYSKQTYAVQITIDQAQNGKLMPTITLDGKQTDQVVAEFINIFNPDLLPETGDNSQVGLFVGMMLVSATMLAVLVVCKKKEEAKA